MQPGFYLDVLGIHIVMIDLACQWIESMTGDDLQEVKLTLLKQAREEYSSMPPEELAKRANQMLSALEESKQADPPADPKPASVSEGSYDDIPF